MVGGMGGIRPRLADILIEDVSTQEAEDLLHKVIDYYKENSKPWRLGFMIDKIGGMEVFKKAILE